jgi:hypothetical protein
MTVLPHGKLLAQFLKGNIMPFKWTVDKLTIDEDNLVFKVDLTDPIDPIQSGELRADMANMKAGMTSKG